MIPEWHERAACRGLDLDWFFPEKHERLNPTALATCATCPVRPQCLADALTDPTRHGLWGATSERQRQRLRHDAAVA